MEALRDFEWNINYLQWLLNSKINQALYSPVQGFARASRAAEQRIVFLEGEVLTFGGVSRGQVISVLTATGIPSEAYEQTVDGPPLYFCSSFNRPDVEFAVPYLLREEDLPYGFAGPNGTFQFSSPEIEKLRRPEGPVELDGVYTYFGDSWDYPGRTPEPVREQKQVITRDKAPAKVAAAPKKVEQPVPQPEPPPEVSGLDLLDSAAAVARLEAQIDRDLQELAKRPRKKFIGARAQEYRFAQYVEDWRQKVERVGTLNYPDAARGKLYGSLLLSVSIRADGSVEKVSVQRSSGHKVLDEAAVRIVKMAAPYAPFPPDIRKDYDIIEITRTWTFERSDRVRAY